MSDIDYLCRTFEEYETAIDEFAIYPIGIDQISGVYINLEEQYLILGLISEVGELAGKIKKGIRDNKGLVNEDAIESELGDVLWYLARLAYCYDISLSEIADTNIKKLKSRKERGVLNGSGDNR